MASYNRVILMGNLTRDPQLKYLPNNTAVCEFGLATNRKWRDRDGNMKEDTCFIEVAAFGRMGETLNQYMSKGKPILIEGRLKFDSWTGQDGTKRSKLSVVAENMQFLGSRGDSPGDGQGAPQRDYAPSGPPSKPPPSSAPPPDSAPPPGGGYEAPVDAPPPSGDDIPF